MRRLLLTVVMALMGAAMVGGAAEALFGEALLPLDQEIGTHASAAGAVLGIGLMWAAFNPSANIGWVRAGILYGFVTVGFEVGAYFLIGSQFFIGPVVFGLASSLLLIALYPQRKELIPPSTARATSPVSSDSKPPPVEPKAPSPTV